MCIWPILVTCKVGAPRLQAGIVHCVAGSAHLEHYGVKVQLVHSVNQGFQFLFLLRGGQVPGGGPVDVGHSSDPGSPELPDWPN